MPEQQTDEFKRHIAYKLRIGDILKGKVILDADRFKHLELEGRQAVRVNIIANITDKFIQDNEKKFASITIDDASGQIKLKTFGEDISKFEEFSQGDTIQVIGLLRSWNDELYIIPEIIKKRDPRYLMVRKLECDLEKPQTLAPEEASGIREKILSAIKQSEGEGGADTEKLILDIKESPNAVNSEIRKLLEEGIIYEPRPGKIRYLG